MTVLLNNGEFTETKKDIYGLSDFEIKAEEEAEKLAREINAIKRTTAQNMLSSAIEIGRLLVEAKQKVHHGDWGTWLRENVSYSVTNANNMMRLYREREKMAQVDLFGNNDLNIFEGLSVSQAIAILDIPAERRAAFVAENNPQDMSVRELQAAIKAREAAEKKAEAAVKELSELKEYASVTSETLDNVTAERDRFAAELEEAEKKLPNGAEKEMEALRKELEEKHRAELKSKLDKAKADADKRLAAAEKESLEAGIKAKEAFEKEKEDLIRAEREKAALEAGESTKRIRELEQRLAAVEITASPRLSEFKYHMEAFQSEYSKMLAITEAAEAEEPEIGVKLREALRAIAGALGNGEK